MSNSESPVFIQQLYSRALDAASRASNLPTVQDETQELVDAAIADLNLLYKGIQALNLFSPNESLEEVATKDLIYMPVPYIAGELESNARSTEREERLMRLRNAKAWYDDFVSLLEAYDIVPEGDKKLYAQKASIITDPARRREVKLAQFKKEKDLKTKISALRARKGLPGVGMLNTYELVGAVLSLVGTKGDEDAIDDDDIAREALILLLRLQYAQTAAHLGIMEQELELIANAPPEQPRTAVPPPTPVDTTWRLDSPPVSLTSQGGPLLDAQGKPLRPFTILPTGASDRVRAQAAVFRPSHRLPTMTIDEFLQEEQRMGNIITGGGPESAQKPTTKEQLSLDAEMEGTALGEEKAEQKRQEDEHWAQFTDENPRGAGNTMNRG